MEIALIISAFVAGVITFLAPCTLPLVPAYLGFISGVSADDLKDPEKAKGARRKIVKNGFAFVIGFSIIFILFGTLAGLLGQSLASYQSILTKVGGVFVIFFGLFMLGVFKIPALHATKKVKLPAFVKVGSTSSSLIIGSIFALGWTPCVGPILGSILLLASTTSTALQGAFLLSVFSLGLAVPFILIAFAFSSATKHIGAITKYFKWISTIGGLFLILLGILLLTDNFDLLVQYGFKIFKVFEYEAILDLL